VTNATQKQATILLVEDEPTELNMLADMLKPLGHAVLCASSGEQALERIAKQPPDLALVDLLMPGMTGFELIKRLKLNKATSDIPIIVVSGLSDVSDRVRALEAGADEYLNKPVHPTELAVRVRTMLLARAHETLRHDYEERLVAEVAEKTGKLQKALEDLKWASLDTVFRLTRAAEYRDEDTGGHIQRISNYTAAIGERLGLEPEVVDCLTYASAMHDVGKIGIPDRILLKPGKLDADEWVIMKQHTTIGAEILQNSQADYVRTGALVAITHHEKWNGSGYPEGLKGEAIPMVGRITAIADVFDALTSKRPYKPPLPIDESLGIIRAGSGIHFDPRVVEAFFAISDKIIAIRKQFEDGAESWLRRVAGRA
jgi:putative two-component system response regulator